MLSKWCVRALWYMLASLIEVDILQDYLVYWSTNVAYTFIYWGFTAITDICNTTMHDVRYCNGSLPPRSIYITVNEWCWLNSELWITSKINVECWWWETIVRTHIVVVSIMVRSCKAHARVGVVSDVMSIQWCIHQSQLTLYSPSKPYQLTVHI